MQPDNIFPQQNPQPQQQAPLVAPIPTPPNTKSKATTILVVLLVLILGAAGAGTYVLLNSLSSKDKELQTAKQELAAANAKVEELSDPQKKVNDTKRKKDLASFVVQLNEYAANNNGKYPTTEPTFFAKDFEALYITGKITDFVDPDTKLPYKFTPVAKVQTPPGVTLGTIQYQWPGKCAGTEFEDVDSERLAAARLILESGEIYCVNT